LEVAFLLGLGMLIGVGTDIVEINRIKKLLNKFPGFPSKILNPEEFRPFMTPEYLAGRWAAKEAVVKAMGVGIGNQCTFKDILILNDELGRPIVSLRGKADQLATSLAHGVYSIHLSISHDSYVVAFCVLAKI